MNTEELITRIEQAVARVAPKVPGMDPGDLALILQQLIQPFGSGAIFLVKECNGRSVYDEEFVMQLIAAVNAAKLEALVVGVTGAYLQGAPLVTRVVDFLVRDTPANRSKIDEVGAAIGAGRAMEISPTLSKVVRLLGARVPVDFIFDEISGPLSFASVRSRAVRVLLGPHEAVVASLEDIIRSKEAAARPKDLAVLPILRDTLRVKKALEE